MLERLTGQEIRDVDFEDNRLGRVLSRLSKPSNWLGIEQGIWSKVVDIYELPSIPLLEERSKLGCMDKDLSNRPKGNFPLGESGVFEDLEQGAKKVLSSSLPIPGVHIDLTASSGYHLDAGGLMQYGKSKDHRPDLRQFKLVGASFEGFLISNQGLPSNEADNPHYLPMVSRVKKIVKKDGLLYSGDSKMADLQTRAHLVNSKDYYLTRLPATFGNAEFIKDCISNGKQNALDLIYAKGKLLGGGYEFNRGQSATIELADGKEKEVKWTERVVVVRSLNYAQGQERRLNRNIDKAIIDIEKLTPEPGRGKRQIRDKEQLDLCISKICEKHKLEPAILKVETEKELTIVEKYVNRGRAKQGEQRPKKQIEKVRFQIKEVSIDEQVLEQTIAGLGWIVYVTQVPSIVMNLTQTVSTYRENNSLENQFKRFKNEPINIRPIWVRNDDQIEGLTNLLSIALRLAKYAETIIQQSLEQQPQEKDRTLEGLYPELPTKKTATPTLKNVALLSSRQKSLELISLWVVNMSNRNCIVLNLFIGKY